MSVNGASRKSGTCQYGTYVFDGSTVTKSIKVRPVEDQAGRTVIYSVYEITLQTWITGATESQTQSAIAELTKPAQKFRYVNKGLGGLAINVGGTGGKRDVVWGPKPKFVEADPGAKNGQATKLTWTVEVAIPTCSDARFQFAAMEFNFEVEYDVNRDGLTTRTYSGFIRIPQTRDSVNSRKLNSTADYWRERINPALIPGFRRVPGTFRLSYDKCTLFFTIVDEQMGQNIPPVGILEVKGPGIRYSSDERFGLKTWNGSISLNYKLAPTTAASVAVKHFGAYVKEKTENLLGKNLIPVYAEFSEPDPYSSDRWVNCSLGFRVVKNLEDILNSGIWKQDLQRPGEGWKYWIASLPLGPRGSAQLAFSPGEDAIVDLCGTDTITTISGRRTDVVRDLDNDLGDLFPPPSKDASYVAYQNSIRWEEESGTATTRPLPESQSALGGAIGGIAFLAPSSTGGGKLDNILTGGKLENVSITQKRTGKSLVIYMEGFAVRAGYAIPKPVLSTVGKAKAIEASRVDKGEGFTQAVISNAGVPLYGAKWRFRYTLEGDPGIKAEEFDIGNPWIDPA